MTASRLGAAAAEAGPSFSAAGSVVSDTGAGYHWPGAALAFASGCREPDFRASSQVGNPENVSPATFRRLPGGS